MSFYQGIGFLVVPIGCTLKTESANTPVGRPGEARHDPLHSGERAKGIDWCGMRCIETIP